MADLIEGAAQGVLQGQVLRLQAGVEALQLLQAGAHDVHDGGLDGAHGRGQLHMELHHLGLVSVQRPVHRRLEPGRGGARGEGGMRPQLPAKLPTVNALILACIQLAASIIGRFSLSAESNKGQFIIEA